MKKILIIVFALIVVAAVAVFYVYTSLDSIIKAAIEKIGSDLTQTEVTLNEVEISPTSGAGALRGFRVTNPQGFSDDDAFRFNEVNVTIDITTINSDPVIIKEIVVDGPRIIYEFGEGSSNLETIKDNVQKQAGGSGGSGGGGNAAAEEGPKIIIENLYLRNGQVGVTAPVLNETVEVPLPTVHLTDIGAEEKGATPGEVAEQIIDSIVASATEAVTSANIDLGDLGKAADRLKDEAQQKLQDATGGAGSAIEEGAKDAEKAVDSIIKGIGGQ